MGFTVNWHRFNPTPDGDGNFAITEAEMPFLDFGAQYGDDPDRLTPPKHVVGLRFQGTSAYNIRVWLASTRAEIIPADKKRPVPRVDVEAVLSSPLRHPYHLIASDTTWLGATTTVNPLYAAVDPYQIAFNGDIVVTPENWYPLLFVIDPDEDIGRISLTPPVGTPNGSGVVWIRDQDLDVIYTAIFTVSDCVFEFHGCRATDEIVYSEDVSDWIRFPNDESSAISLLDAPMNRQFEAYSQPLGIGVVVPAQVHDDFIDITLQNLRLLAAFDTDDQP